MSAAVYGRREAFYDPWGQRRERLVTLYEDPYPYPDSFPGQAAVFDQVYQGPYCDGPTGYLRRYVTNRQEQLPEQKGHLWRLENLNLDGLKFEPFILVPWAQGTELPQDIADLRQPRPRQSRNPIHGEFVDLKKRFLALLKPAADKNEFGPAAALSKRVLDAKSPAELQAFVQAAVAFMDLSSKRLFRKPTLPAGLNSCALDVLMFVDSLENPREEVQNCVRKTQLNLTEVSQREADAHTELSFAKDKAAPSVAAFAKRAMKESVSWESLVEEQAGTAQKALRTLKDDIMGDLVAQRNRLQKLQASGNGTPEISGHVLSSLDKLLCYCRLIEAVDQAQSFAHLEALLVDRLADRTFHGKRNDRPWKSGTLKCLLRWDALMAGFQKAHPSIANDICLLGERVEPTARPAPLPLADVPLFAPYRELTQYYDPDRHASFPIRVAPNNFDREGSILGGTDGPPQPQGTHPSSAPVALVVSVSRETSGDSLGADTASRASSVSAGLGEEGESGLGSSGSVMPRSCMSGTRPPRAKSSVVWADAAGQDLEQVREIPVSPEVLAKQRAQRLERADPMGCVTQ